ncbi:hypothetical protein D3C73_1538040 [compost metagenome]
MRDYDSLLVNQKCVAQSVQVYALNHFCHIVEHNIFADYPSDRAVGILERFSDGNGEVITACVSVR